VNARSIALASVVAVAALTGARCVSSRAAGAPARTVDARRAADAPSSSRHTSASTGRAPKGPPLASGDGGSGTGGGGEEGAGVTPQAQADPLVSNGLGSPTCRGALSGELSPPARRNCQTSGFVAAPAPTGNYGLDVHIDTGLLGLGAGGALSAVQDIIVTPLWMGLVWAVHALVVMLEWCFTIDLLDSPAATEVGRGLRQMQASLTEPWLPIALAVASVLVLYHGLIRRRVAQTLGEALLMGVMMVGGIWVIADPTGTVGVLGEWANQASMGTLAVAARGAPAGPGRALGSSLGTLFATAIEVPWCYLEFGDVGWCREPSQLDARLRAAALRIAAQETAQAGCRPSPGSPAACTPAGSGQASALASSAQLLREARSNGAIFLALPANGPARNSINEQGSLLRTLCQSSEATNCHGPTATQAEFRTNGGTWSRLAGLALIAVGLLGMLLLLGAVVLRLLASSIFGLLYLLLAPAMVLAPAFGERGRAVFRRWAAQLLGAVVSKLVFSFLLGVVLTVLAILSKLTALGWWTQWLLISAFWWGAFLRRHQALGGAGSVLGDAGSAGEARQRSPVRRMSDALEIRKGIAAARWARGRFAKQAPETGRSERARVGHQRARAQADEQVTRTLIGEHRDARERAGSAAEIQRHLSIKRMQLERVGRERAIALSGGDGRRAAELAHRGERVRVEIEREQEALSAAQRVVRDGEHAQRRTGAVAPPERRAAHERFLDAQAALPGSAQAAHGGTRREYPALAALAGYGRAEYERLDPRRQRAARLEIDRELALRRELGETARTFADGESKMPGRRERRKANSEFDDALERRMHDGGRRMPTSRRRSSGIERWREDGRAQHGSIAAGSSPSAGSSVMRDAREVAARRKRQLGTDRP
jgi:hypothetical protein